MLQGPGLDSYKKEAGGERKEGREREKREEERREEKERMLERVMF
jgi:hypothetical protein